MSIADRELRYASTVILKRGQATPEIYMLKRSASASFMPNALVFPGGALDEEDRSSEWSAMTNMSRSQAQEALHMSDPTLAHALMIAAARETFEEAGILLTHSPAVDQRTLAKLRGQLNGKAIEFPEVVKELGVRLDLNSMHLISRWRTPKVERKRFDAFFFVAEVPDGDLGESADGYETLSGRWYSPADVLHAHRKRDVQLAPPTLRAIETLNRQASSDWSALRCTDSTPVCPQFLPNQTHPTLTLPGDPDFDPPGSTLNRFELIDGYWSSQGLGF